MKIAIINGYNKNSLPVLAAPPHSWAHTLALDNTSGSFVVCRSICTVRKCLIPKKDDTYHFYLILSYLKRRKKTMQISLKRNQNCLFSEKTHIRKCPVNARRYTSLCYFGPRWNCAQLMNVKEKGYQPGENFLHFAV